MRLFQVKDSDATWRAVKDAWRAECEAHGEDFDEYAFGHISELDKLAAIEHPRAGVYALETAAGERPAAVCQLNRTQLPGFVGEVLRLRFLTLAPRYDFGDVSVDDYGDVLGGVLAGVVSVSYGDLSAPHIKFHLASPADRQFFRSLEGPLRGIAAFESVQFIGSWLLITKKPSGFAM